MRGERILRKLRLNGAAFAILCRFAREDTRQMTEAEARKILGSVYPEKESSCRPGAFETPRDARTDLSVIVPTWNNVRYIAACMDSVLAQETRFTFEVIVVNDGSTDGTEAALTGYTSDPRVTVVSQKNGGVSRARNRAMSMARGKYLLYLDGDDILLPGAFERLLSKAEASGAAIAEGGYRMIDQNGALIRHVPHGEGDARPTGLVGFACGKVIRRDALEGLRFPEDMYFEDSIIRQVVLERMERDGLTACRIADEVFGYRYNMSGFSQTYRARPVSIDAVWITDILLKDREALGLMYTESFHEHLLDMAVLAWRRTQAQPENVRRAVFTMYRNWLREGFTTERTDRQVLESAIRNGQFRRFELYCRLKG